MMVSMESFEQAEREGELLRVLARGEKEIAAGDGIELDDVLREADALLACKSE